jgi:hypothetical protein
MTVPPGIVSSHPCPVDAGHERNISTYRNGVNPHVGLTHSHEGHDVQDPRGSQVLQP